MPLLTIPVADQIALAILADGAMRGLAPYAWWSLDRKGHQLVLKRVRQTAYIILKLPWAETTRLGDCCAKRRRVAMRLTAPIKP